MAKNKTQERVCSSAVQCSAVQYLVFFFLSCFLFLAAAVAVRGAALRCAKNRLLLLMRLESETRDGTTGRDDETTYQAGLEEKAEIDRWGIEKQ